MSLTTHFERAAAQDISQDDAQLSALAGAVWPRWQRCMFIGAAMLILCSCRSMPPTAQDAPAETPLAAAATGSEGDGAGDSTLVSSRRPTARQHALEPVASQPDADQREQDLQVVTDTGEPTPQAPAAAALPAPPKPAPSQVVPVSYDEIQTGAEVPAKEAARSAATTIAQHTTAATTSQPVDSEGLVLIEDRVDMNVTPAARQGILGHRDVHPGPPQVYNSLDFAEYGPPAENWRPPGVEGPWPRDEYLRDGGDHGTPVGVRPDWTVVGLETEDTVGMYDTLDGETFIQPSNQVVIYAPRFGAVRRVDDVHINEGQLATGGVNLDVALADADFTANSTTTLQQLQLQGGHLTRGPVEHETLLGDQQFELRRKVGELEGPVQSHEDFSLIRYGRYSQDEAAMLRESTLAAIGWSNTEQVKVILDDVAATAVSAEIGVATIYHLAEPNSPRLRVVKTASTKVAQVGEFVDFTIRFDNIGNQVMGNVVLVDNLTTRLELVPDSAQSSLEATFIEEPNRADSLTLRWEIAQPLGPGEGGVIRFRCRVR